jgi:two-component sensor histidine kinase
LIVNELVSNSLKYAFPHGEKGEVRIEIYSKTPGNFIILISDNGVGLPEGIDLYNTKTLGLQLVSNLVEQLAGIMEFHGEHGTKFKIQFSTN